jgi:thiamine biosynthesis lipoprotein
MSTAPTLRRLQPWLGTFVEIRVDGLPTATAMNAIVAGFAEVAAVHALMSFHEVASDLSRLNRHAASEAVAIDVRTREVIAAALAFAAESDGCFDPTIAARLVAWERLPRPVDAPAPDPHASWRDIELVGDSQVRFHRPVWLDLGGIAKGYAVDRALDVLRLHGATAACVNAGGDLKRFGDARESVELRHAASAMHLLPAIELGNGAVASSVVDRATDHRGRHLRTAHVNPRNGRSMRARRAVSVIADTCMTADALTKVVLADVRVGQRLLRAHAASACLSDGSQRFRILGDA